MKEFYKNFVTSNETVESSDVECGACFCTCLPKCECAGDSVLYTTKHYGEGTTEFNAINAVVFYQPAMG